MHYRHFSKELIGIHAWRQTQTQSTINNFSEEDMNILNPRRNERGNGDGIFRMEFPVMQWLTAATFKVFGNHLIITRIFMFIIGILSVLGMYNLLKALFQNDIIAVIGAWAFNFSPSFYYYTINPLPDNLALCCSLWGIAFFFSWIRKNNWFLLPVSGLLLSLGTLCKLPFILYYLVPLTYFILISGRQKPLKSHVMNIFNVFIFLIFPLSWYIAVIPQWHGNGIVKGVLDNKFPYMDILDYLQHNLISTLPELLLNYGSVLFYIAGFYFLIKRKSFKNKMFPVLAIWSLGILAYFLFEINMIAKIHDYYLFPFYPVLFILVSYGAYNLLNLEKRFFRYLTMLLLLILPLTAFLRMQNRWDTNSPGFNKDLLEYKIELRKAAPKNALCVIGNDQSHFIFFYYIDKKGWGFDNDNLDAQNLKMMIREGAEYLYTDSRAIENKKEIVQMFDTLILEKGTVKVYRLKKDSNQH
jgi:hypothetical protein